MSGDEKEEILSFDDRDRMFRIWKNEELIAQVKYDKFERFVMARRETDYFWSDSRILVYAHSRVFRDSTKPFEITVKVFGSTQFFVCQTPHDREELATLIENIMAGKIIDEKTIVVRESERDRERLHP